MIDKSALLKPRIPEAEVEVPGVGALRVRGLSRQEVLDLQQFTKDEVALERKVLVLGLVEPQLTEDEVAQWHAAATQDEVAAVVDAIRGLSGLKDGAPKEAYKSL